MSPQKHQIMRRSLRPRKVHGRTCAGEHGEVVGIRGNSEGLQPSVLTFLLRRRGWGWQVVALDSPRAAEGPVLRSWAGQPVCPEVFGRARRGWLSCLCPPAPRPGGTQVCAEEPARPESEPAAGEEEGPQPRPAQVGGAPRRPARPGARGGREGAAGPSAVGAGGRAGEEGARRFSLPRCGRRPRPWRTGSRPPGPGPRSTACSAAAPPSPASAPPR